MVYRRRTLIPDGEPMRRYLLVLPFIVACGGAETPPADSAAAAAPAVITDADVSGTWTGTATIEGTDSVVAHWTQVCSAGSCRGTTQETPGDTVVSTYTIAADSAHGVSQPFADKSAGGVRVIDHWIAKPSGGSQMTGYGWFVLADKPDSVVARYRMTGTKTP
jgi:hypothetical protein